MTQKLFPGFFLSSTTVVPPRAKAAETAAPAPVAVVPGNGLAQHGFVDAGASREHRAFIVRKDNMVSRYDHRCQTD